LLQRHATGALVLRCAAPDALSAEAAAEAIALSAAAGRRLSIGRTAPPAVTQAAAVTAAAAAAAAAATRSSGDAVDAGAKTAPVMRVPVVNIDTRLTRTFLLEAGDAATVGGLRAAIVATGSFAAGGGEDFSLVIGTQPPLADGAPLSEVVDRTVLLLPKAIPKGSVAPEGMAPVAAAAVAVVEEPPPFIDDQGNV
jgi:hypothetical protein